MILSIEQASWPPALITYTSIVFQANWLADPAWRSRRSLLGPSSSDSQESERALSVDSKTWHTPTPPPPYDEALHAPERVYRVELNHEVSDVMESFSSAKTWTEKNKNARQDCQA